MMDPEKIDIEEVTRSSGEIEMVPTDSIKPASENDEIYGEINLHDNDLIDLANDISRNGVREPIQVSAEGFILSGHRRYAASKLAKLEKVPIRRLKLLYEAIGRLDRKRLLAAYNQQRVKSAAVRVKEKMLSVDPDIAYEAMKKQREERDSDAPPRIEIDGEMKRSEISDRKQPFLIAAIEVINGLQPFWPVSVRQVHYGLLNNPPLRNTSKGKQKRFYANDRKSYHDLCDLLTRARLKSLIPRGAISDETRPVSGTRYCRDRGAFVDLEAYHLFRGYRRDLLQSQSDHIELVVEKMTVQGIIKPIAMKYCLPMTVGRGYCSLEPRWDIVDRFRQSGKDRLIILAVADFDPDGDEIAESLVRSIRDDFDIDDIVASKILLRQDQVQAWQLPPNGADAKQNSAQFEKFVDRYGATTVFELEAVPPLQIQEAVESAILGTINIRAYNDEIEEEREDASKLMAMKIEVADLLQQLSERDS